MSKVFWIAFGIVLGFGLAQMCGVKPVSWFAPSEPVESPQPKGPAPASMNIALFATSPLR